MERCEVPFSVEVVHLNGSATVLLTGELDVAAAPVLRRSINAIVSPHLQAVSLDLRGLTFVDVAGLRALLDARAIATGVGASFHLLSVSDRMHEVIGIIRFDELEEATEPA